MALGLGLGLVRFGASTRLHMGQTLIQIREKQFHHLLVKYGMRRLGLPGTIESRKRSEFFTGSP